MNDYKPSKSQLKTNGKTHVKTKIPWWIWVIIVIIIVITIVFVILWLTKSSPKVICAIPLSGIDQTCTTTSNCANGLTCNSGTCICLAPLPPTDLTMTSPSAGSVTIKFTPINIAPFSYNVILFNQNDSVNAVRFRNVNVSTIALITISYTSQLAPGTYFVRVIPISPTCSSGTNLASIGGVVVA